jgi:transposase
VQVVERWILARLRDMTFFDLADLNRALRVLNDELNDRPMRHLGQSRRELFEMLDRPALKPLPAQPYELATWKKARVHIDYHVEFEKHFYSVPYTLIHQEVDVRATEHTIEIFYRQQRQAVHPRSTTRGRFTTQREHMPPAHRAVSDWSPERFQSWAEQIGPHTAQLIEAVLISRLHPQQAYRTCLGILSLAKRYSATRLEAACRYALPTEIRSYKGLHHILDAQLDRLTPTDPLPDLAPTDHANLRGSTYYH